MKFNLEAHLQISGPATSSALKKVLKDRGMTDQAARQRISRGGGEIMHFRHFPLPKREGFLYLASHYNNLTFWERLMTAHTEAHSVYAHTFHALKSYRGAIPSYLLAKVSGSPVRLSKHVPVAVLEARMVSGGMLRRESDGDLGEYLISYIPIMRVINTTAQVRNQLLVEDILIKGVSEWLRKNGLASFHKIKVRDKNGMPDFSHHHWDITAPSYLRPLAIAREGDTANGFVVADIIFGKVTELGIRGFLGKVNRCRNLKNTRPFLAILVADSFDPGAQKLAQHAGVMITTVKNFLGVDIADLMNSLLNTLNRAAAVAAANPDKINQLFRGLQRIEGAAINIRGAMFEMLVGHMVLKTQNVSTIDLNKKISVDADKAEIDVIGLRNESEIKCYECKGYEVARLIDGPMIERWIKQVQIIRRYFQSVEVYRERKLTFAYWTASDFTDEAISLMRQFQERNRRLNIEWKNCQQILAVAREEKLTSIVGVLNEHYARHPLADDPVPARQSTALPTR